MKVEQPSVGLFVEIIRYISIAVVSVLKTSVDARDFYSLISSKTGEKFTVLLRQAMEALIKSRRLVEYNKNLSLWKIIPFDDSIIYSTEINSVFFESLQQLGIYVDDELRTNLEKTYYQGKKFPPREIAVGITKASHLCFDFKIETQKNLFNDNEYDYHKIKERIKTFGGQTVPLELIGQIIRRLPGSDNYLFVTETDGIRLTKDGVIMDTDGTVSSEEELCYLIDFGFETKSNRYAKTKKIYEKIKKAVKNFFVTL